MKHFILNGGWIFLIPISLFLFTVIKLWVQDIPYWKTVSACGKKGHDFIHETNYHRKPVQAYYKCKNCGLEIKEGTKAYKRLSNNTGIPRFNKMPIF